MSNFDKTRVVVLGTPTNGINLLVHPNEPILLKDCNNFGECVEFTDTKVGVKLTYEADNGYRRNNIIRWIPVDKIKRVYWGLREVD